MAANGTYIPAAAVTRFSSIRTDPHCIGHGGMGSGSHATGCCSLQRGQYWSGRFLRGALHARFDGRSAFPWRSGKYTLTMIGDVTANADRITVQFYLSMWYKRSERQYRIALFFSAASMAGTMRSSCDWRNVC